MTVHVSEVHTEVRPADGANADPGDHGRSPSGVSVEQHWRESAELTGGLARRTAAEGFDD